MNLQNFQNQIDPNILKRGKDYFENKNVEYLEEIKKNHWVADVIGSEDYQVEIKLSSQGEIKNCSCTCPYDYGAYCKHMVAVFFAVLEARTIIVSTKNSPKKKNFTFEDILKKITQEEFQVFIRQYASKNKKFKDEFELYFADKNPTLDLEKKFTVLVRSLIRSHKFRGYIDYSASNKLGKELYKLVDQAQQFLEIQNYRDAFTVSKVIVHEIVPIFEFCDDSNGYVADCAYASIEILRRLCQMNCPIEFKELIFQFIITQFDSYPPIFEYGDFGYELMDVLYHVAFATQNTNELLTFIDKKLEGMKSNYQRNFLVRYKIMVLNELGRNEEAQKIIFQNIEDPDIRAQVVKNCIEQKNYEEAKKLLFEGIKLAEQKNHSGTVNKWETELFNIAISENNIDEIRRYSKKFSFSRGLNKKYYNLWKNTYSKEEWADVIEKEIHSVTKKVRSHYSKNSFFDNNWLNVNLLSYLGPIFIEEKFLDRLFELVKNVVNFDTLSSYYPDLKSDFKNELYDLFLKALESEGPYLEGRNQYKEFTNKIKFVIKEYPESKLKTLEILKLLIQKYPKRRAMVEEFEKLL